MPAYLRQRLQRVFFIPRLPAAERRRADDWRGPSQPRPLHRRQGRHRSLVQGRRLPLVHDDEGAAGSAAGPNESFHRHPPQQVALL